MFGLMQLIDLKHEGSINFFYVKESPDYKKKAVFGFTTKGDDLFN
jgi:hypothetical protein